MKVFPSFSFFSSWFQPEHEKPLFSSQHPSAVKKHVLSNQIQRTEEERWNHRIASKLPQFSFKSVKIEKDGDDAVFKATEQSQTLCDIWEIVDERTVPPSIKYNICEENGGDDIFVSQEELFSRLTEECGILFRLDNLSTGKAHFFCTRDASSKKPFQEVPFEDLFYLAKTLDERSGHLQFPQQPLFHSSEWAKEHKWTILSYSFLSFANLMVSPFLAAKPPQWKGPDVPSWMSNIVGGSLLVTSSLPPSVIAMLSLLYTFPTVAGQVSLKTPFPDITMDPNEVQKILNVVSHFTSDGRETLLPGVSLKPEFVHENFTYSQPGSSFSSGDIHNAVVDGSTLYAFGNNSFQMWNISNATDPQLLANVSHSEPCQAGNLFGSSAFLGCMPEMLKVFNVTDPQAPTQTTSIPLGAPPQFVEVDETNQRVWVGTTDGTVEGFSSKLSSLGSYNNTLPLSAFHVSANGLLYLSDATGLHLIDPSSMQLLATFPVSSSSSIQTISDIFTDIYAAADAEIQLFRFVDDPTNFFTLGTITTPYPVCSLSLGRRTTGSGGGGVMYGSYCDQNQIAFIELDPPSSSTIVHTIPLAKTPRGVFADGNRLYTYTENGIESYSTYVLDLTLSPTDEHQGWNNMTITSAFNGYSSSAIGPFTIEVNPLNSTTTTSIGKGTSMSTSMPPSTSFSSSFSSSTKEMPTSSSLQSTMPPTFTSTFSSSSPSLDETKQTFSSSEPTEDESGASLQRNDYMLLFSLGGLVYPII